MGHDHEAGRERPERPSRRWPWRSTAARTSGSSTTASAQLADGIFRKSSPFYKNPGYPAYNPTKAKALIDAYKSKNNVSSVAFVMDIVAGSATATKAFDFFQQEFAKIGVTITPRSLVQSTLINNVIYGEYDCAGWNQFGGCDQSLNYVWFDSQSATASTGRRWTGHVRAPGGHPDRRCGELRPPGRPGRRDGAPDRHGGATSDRPRRRRPGRR